jgi:Ni/Co efflux regulator RcnB
MKRLLIATSLAVLCLSATTALAGGKDKHRGHHDDHGTQDRGHHDNGRHNGWHKGERIEVIYLQPRYHVQDYRHYRLAPPPRGHRWIRTHDGKFILIAVATGIIADILLHH